MVNHVRSCPVSSTNGIRCLHSFHNRLYHFPTRVDDGKSEVTAGCLVKIKSNWNSPQREARIRRLKLGFSAQ